MDRCPYHDDLVIAVGQINSKIDALHEDVREIKGDLYEAGNGGVIGWVHRRRGVLSVLSVGVTAIISILTAVVTAFVVSMLVL